MPSAAARPSPSPSPSAATRPTPSSWLLLGFACGAAGPLLSALLFRSYGPPMESGAAETARQLCLPYLAAEVGVVLYAARRGVGAGGAFAAMPRPARWTLGLFLASFWIGSAFVSPQPAVSLGLTLAWAMQLPFAAAVYGLARAHGPADARAVGAGLSAGLAGLAAATAVHFLTPPAGLVVPWGPFGWGGAVPGFVSHRLLGAWCAAVLALLLGVAWRERPGETRWLLPAMMLAATFLAWTGTRAALVGVVAALATTALVGGRPASPRLWPVLALMAGVAALVGPALAPHGDPAFLFVRPPATLATADGVSSGRLSYWHDLLAIAAERPLLGWGAASSLWMNATGGGMRHVQPHNVIVQFLLNWGLVPTLPALALLAAAFRAAHVRVRRAPERLPFLAMLNAVAVMGLFDGTFHFPQFLMLMAAAGAICLAPVARDA